MSLRPRPASSRADARPDDRRIVVTGLGVVSALGTGVAAFSAALRGGASGVGDLARFDASGLDCRLAAEVRDAPDPPAGTGRAAWYAFLAAQEALADAGLTAQSAPESLRAVGVASGSTKGLADALEAFWRDSRRPGPGVHLPPGAVTAIEPARFVAERLGLGGPVTGAAAACSSGPCSIALAAGMLLRGQAEAMLAGSADAPIVPSLFASFANLGAMTLRQDRGATAARPFCATRDGFVLGEGAAMLCLETLGHARSRGARIYAELAGWALAGEAAHPTSPPADPHVPARAIHTALDRAGLAPTDVEYVNAHGTATRRNDGYETRAIKAALGDHAYRIPVSSIKGATGHPMAAAGAIDAVACVVAMREGFIPPTLNYHEPDPECDLDYVPNAARQLRPRVVVSTSLGFGGHVAVLSFVERNDSSRCTPFPDR